MNSAPSVQNQPMIQVIYTYVGNVIAKPRTLSLAFTVMVMIFLIAGQETGITIIHWNYFGEMFVETILFVGAFIVIIIGFIVSYKNFKKSI